MTGNVDIPDLQARVIRARGSDPTYHFFSPLEQTLIVKGRVRISTVVFYTDHRAGEFGLHFLGFYGDGERAVAGTFEL